MSQTRPPRLSPAEASKKISLILREGTVAFTAHCRRRMRERGVDDLDIAHVLKEGAIVREAEWDSPHSNWKYRKEGTDLEGGELVAIVVIFDPESSLLIVTVF